MTKKRIFYLEQYFFPEAWNGVEITQKIIDIFVKRGDQVNILCGSKPYINASFKDSHKLTDIDLINIIRLIDLGFSKKKFFRFLNSFLMSIHAFLILILEKNIDLIVVQTNPPPIVLAASLSAFIKRKPLLIIAMDIYPEVIINSVNIFKNNFLKNFLKFPFDLSYRSAKKVVSLGPVMTNILLSKGVKKGNVVEISNWATGIKKIKKYEDNFLKKDQLIVTYTGNIGIAHEVKTILKVAARFKKTNINIKFIFACKGSRFRELNNIVNQLNISSIVEIREIIPASDFDLFIKNSDISLVSINEGYQGLVFPSKAIGLMARGIPILYIGPYSDINNLLNNSNSGICFKIGEDLKIFNYLVKLYNNKILLNEFSKNAKKYYDQFLVYEKAKKQYLKLFQEILS